jgi:hypothetical protein
MSEHHCVRCATRLRHASRSGMCGFCEIERRDEQATAARLYGTQHREVQATTRTAPAGLASEPQPGDERHET